MITFVLSNDYIYGCKWYKDESTFQVRSSFYHPFNSPLLNQISDETQLNHLIDGSLRLCSQTMDISGEPISVILDSTLTFEDILQTDSDLPVHIPRQYIDWYKETILCDYSDDFEYSISEKHRNINEFRVTYFPRLLPDIIKMSVRELGGKPFELKSIGSMFINRSASGNSMIVRDDVHGYTIYGDTDNGSFISNLRFLKGEPKFSEWTGNTDIRSLLFTEQYDGADIEVHFIGSFTDNKKAHWASWDYFIEDVSTNKSDWENLQTDLNEEQLSILTECISEYSDPDSNLFDHAIRVSAKDEVDGDRDDKIYHENIPEIKGRKTPSPFLTFLFIVVGLSYIYINRAPLIELGSQLIQPDSETVAPLTVDPRIHTIANTSESQLNFINLQIGYDLSTLRFMVTEENAAEIHWEKKPEDIKNRFSYLGSNITMDGLKVQLSLPLIKGQKLFQNNKPVESWLQYTYRYFPTGEIHVFKPISFADTYYHPITIQLNDISTIINFIKWLRNGPTNSLLRKSIVMTDSNHDLTATFYISLFNI